MAAKKTQGTKVLRRKKALEPDYPKYDMTGVYWWDLRDKMYSDLENRSIPGDLIDWARTGLSHAQVRWLTVPAAGTVISDDQFEICEVPSGLDPEQLLARGARLDEAPETVGEALAYGLSVELSRLREAKGAPVRLGKRLPRSTIAWIALDLLTSHVISPPGPYLKELLYALLGVGRPQDNDVKVFAARYRAAWIVAEDPDVDSERIAQKLGVDRSSISRWRKDPEFQRSVSNLQNASRLRPKRTDRES